MDSKYQILLKSIKKKQPTLLELFEECSRLNWTSNDWIEVLKEIRNQKLTSNHK